MPYAHPEALVGSDWLWRLGLLLASPLIALV